MINFFRKTRKKLADQNKFLKYSRYAIGEILLVVIGILIALQINNKNEAVKAREFELKMLNEVRNELIQDTIYFNMIIKRAERAYDGSNKMMELSVEPEVNLDTVSKYGTRMLTKFQFIYHKGAYEAIKSTGIDKISSDKVRELLTDMYDFRMPRAKNLILRNMESKMSTVDEMNILATSNFKKMPDGSVRPQIKPKFPFSNDQNIVNLILDKTSYNRNAIARLDNLIEACLYMLQTLDEELEIENVLEGIPTNIWRDD